MTVTNRIIENTPYRTSTIHYHCEVCRERAQMRCLCCGRTFCLTHGPTNMHCPACEDRIKVGGRQITALAGVIFTGIAVIIALTLQVDLWAIWIMVASAVVLFSLLAGIGRWIMLKKIRTCPPGEEVILEEIEISIAARTAEDFKIRLGRRRGSGHSAGALPTVPMYQRTYGAG